MSAWNGGYIFGLLLTFLWAEGSGNTRTFGRTLDEAFLTGAAWFASTAHDTAGTCGLADTTTPGVLLVAATTWVSERTKSGTLFCPSYKNVQLYKPCREFENTFSNTTSS